MWMIILHASGEAPECISLVYVLCCACVLRPECAEHAMNCFGRLVKALLGDSAMSADKLGFGASIEILGVVLRLSASGYEAVPSRKTRDKCLKAILKALDQNILNAGDAQKLAGRLNWAGSYLFHRLGRAMLKPIYDQKFNKHGTLARSLLEALRWWRMVLQYEVVEERCWWAPETPLAHMFVDARGVPPRCAAVLFIDYVVISLALMML